nr:very short patch repair endonuclease [Methylobacterium sp. Leaf466]
MDRVDVTKRSAIMRSVRQKDTGPELALRKALHARGLRYRLQAKELPGRPDVVFRRRRACIFVHGCFWHRHGCPKTTTPKSNEEFWNSKFQANEARDRRAVEALLADGWRVATIWECGLKGKADPGACADYVVRWLDGGDPTGEYPPPTSVSR